MNNSVVFQSVDERPPRAKKRRLVKAERGGRTAAGQKVTTAYNERSGEVSMTEGSSCRTDGVMQ